MGSNLALDFLTLFVVYCRQTEIVPRQRLKQKAAFALTSFGEPKEGAVRTMLRSSGFAALVVALAFSMSVSACGGAVSLIEPTPVPNPSPSPSPSPNPGPTPSEPSISIRSVSPDAETPMNYIGPVGQAITTIYLGSHSFGDRRCEGEGYWAVALTDKPGYFIWDSIDEKPFSIGDLHPRNYFRPSLKATVWDRRITKTTHVVAYLVCGADLRARPGPEVPRDENFQYKSEAEFANNIWARAEVQVTWHWQ